ncbi:transposase [Streptomyces sp. NPDC058867]|uniref:transposase n=1 Tax=unclassified Streptomyces TaxID=2593676 RepID=UPI00368B8744
MQYAEGLTDRQAADQVRARMDWKFLLGLELDDPGFDASVLSLFRACLVVHGLEQTTLDLVLERLRGMGLLQAGGRQRTGSTHVLAAVRTLNRMEFVGETLRAALEALAVVAPRWLSDVVTAEWAERYGPRVDDYRFPRGEEVREQWSEQVGRDGFVLLEAAHTSTAPDWLREIEAFRSCESPGSSRTTVTRRGCAGGRARISRRFITGCARPMTLMPDTEPSVAPAGPATRCI